MKFTTQTNANGTSLQGYVTTSYHQLVARFGEPAFTDGDKTTAEWHLEFEDGTVATIYDWKQTETPWGTYQWHVGGRDQRAVWAVSAMVNMNL